LDLQRFAAGRPILARRSSAIERSWRWTKRNLGLAALNALAASLITIIAIVSSVAAWTYRAQSKDLRFEKLLSEANLHRADQALVETKAAKKATEDALAHSEESRKQAIVAESTARHEAAKAKAVNEFLTQDILTQAEPANNDVQDKLTLLEAVERAAGKVGERFRDQPQVEAELPGTIAETFHGLGSFAAAERQIRARLEIESRLHRSHSIEALKALGAIGHYRYHLGADREAIDPLQKAAEGLKRALGPDHLDTLEVRGNLAVAYEVVGRTAEATAIKEETLKLKTATLGLDHPLTFPSRNNLAVAYLAAGRTAEAIAMHEETLKLSTAKRGPDHPDTLATRMNLAQAYNKAGRTAEAIAMNQETLELLTQKFGPDHPNTLACRGDLAIAYVAAGRAGEAIALLEKMLKAETAKLGPDHPVTLKRMANLAASYWWVGKLDRSVPLFEEVLERTTAQLGADNPSTWMVKANLGTNYKDAGRLEEALALLEEVNRERHRIPSFRSVGSNLMDCYIRAGRICKAVTLADEQLAQGRATLPPSSPQLAGLLARAGSTLLRAKAWSKAEPLLRASLAIGGKTAPNDQQTFATESLLGSVLLGQNQYAAAEPLLIQGYEGMKAREAKIPVPGRAKLTEAGARIIELYDVWNKPEKVAQWKAKLGIVDLPADVFAAPRREIGRERGR
jgi:eukaryotic-like serine/threonine-protein kinase